LRVNEEAVKRSRVAFDVKFAVVVQRLAAERRLGEALVARRCPSTRGDRSHDGTGKKDRPRAASATGPRKQLVHRYRGLASIDESTFVDYVERCFAAARFPSTNELLRARGQPAAIVAERRAAQQKSTPPEALVQLAVRLLDTIDVHVGGLDVACLRLLPADNWGRGDLRGAVFVAGSPSPSQWSALRRPRPTVREILLLTADALADADVVAVLRHGWSLAVFPTCAPWLLLYCGPRRHAFRLLCDRSGVALTRAT
jgi:hypothetical protein